MKHKGTSIGLLTLVVLLLGIAQADFSGTVTPSDSSIEATGVTYTFQLGYRLTMTDEDGKLVIRFPGNFEDQFTVTSVEAVSGFTATGALTFDWLPSIRLLSIYGAFDTQV